MIIGEEDLKTTRPPNVPIASKSFSIALKAEPVKAIPLLPSALTVEQVHTTSSICSLSLLPEVLGTTLPSSQQKSTKVAQDVEQCRLSIADNARRVVAVNEEVFRLQLIGREGSEQAEIKNLAELVRFVGSRLRRTTNEINNAFELIVKACVCGFVGYTNAADEKIPELMGRFANESLDH